MIDLLYVSHNRLRYTQETFPALVKNTNWDLVARLHVLDDYSTDGTAQWLGEQPIVWQESTCRVWGGEYPVCSFDSRHFGGPVAAMNHAISNCDTDVLVKVDNDLLLCDWWLDNLLNVLGRHPEIDVLGFEAGFGEGLARTGDPRRAIAARHCGGIGAFRTRIFRKRRPRGHGTFFGLTDFQRHYAECAWLSPDLPCPLLDHLPFEPWRSLAAEYCARGWSRPWPAYPAGMREYWAWHFSEVAA